MRFSIRLIVLGLLAPVVAAPAFAAPKNLADYPLRVRVYNTHWGGSVYRGYHGYGKANLIDGPETHAMAYDFECDEHFMVSDRDDAYPAKWKKPGEKIEMLMGEIGSTKVHTCQLSVTLKETVYRRTSNGLLETISQAEYARMMTDRSTHDAALAPADVDPAHFPLQLAVLDLEWGGGGNGIARAQGHANVKTASGISSVDFAAECPVKFKATPEGRYYKARWIAEGSQMELLLHSMGDPTKAATCSLKTMLHDDVYVLQSEGVVKAVSQAKYKAMQSADAKEMPGGQ